MPVVGLTFTVIATFSFWPCVIPVVGVTENVVVVGTVETLVQLVARLFTFNDPNPVAKS